jgi:integrase
MILLGDDYMSSSACLEWQGICVKPLCPKGLTNHLTGKLSMANRKTALKLTKRTLDATHCPETGQVFLRDADLPGFGVRLTKSGKVFILEKRIHGRMRRLTIGAYGPLTLEQAREKALALTHAILEGHDPAQARLERRQELSWEELTALYLERHAPRKRTAWNDRNMLNSYFESWRNRRLSSLSRKDVALLHHEIGQTAKYAANRVVALVRKMFNLARVWGFYDGENPATGIELFPDEKRDRFVQPHELPKLFEALNEEPNPYIKAAFLVALLTGARRGEVLAMRWKDIDIEQATWRIPHTKARRPHWLPLPQAVVPFLMALPRLHDNPYVFPGRDGKGHLINIAKAWTRIRTRAGLTDVRIHDLRRTLGSWLAASGASLPLIGRALNHTQVSTTAVYARLNLDPVRTALDANAERMLALVDRLA